MNESEGQCVFIVLGVPYESGYALEMLRNIPFGGPIDSCALHPPPLDQTALFCMVEIF